MPLETLRKQIFERTAPLKFPRSENVSRTFYVLISSEMSYLKDWFQRWFPITDEDLKKIYPWIILDTATDISKVVANAWNEAFDAETLRSLIVKGFHLIEAANQIILVGDLTEENILEKFNTIYNSFQDSLNIKAPQTPLYWIGLFLLRKREGEDKVKSLLDFEGFSKWAQGHLDRLFLVDISNEFGVVASKPRDLLGQLLYILTRKPIELSLQGEAISFGEWMRRDDPAEGRFTGFSAVSLLSPIDQILETALIIKGGEVLEEAFFGDFPEDKVKGYLTSLLNETGLNSYENISALLKNNPMYPLISPLERGVSWNLAHPEGFIAHADDLDAKLPGYADENEKRMKEIGKILLENFRYKLLDHLNAAISREKGGLRIAERFLQYLRKHVEDIEKAIPEKSPQQVYPDPSPLIQKLKDKLDRGPRRESVAVRTAMLGITALLGVIASRSLLDIPSLLFPLCFLLSVGGGLLHWLAWRDQTERLVIEIQKAIQKKWEVLMKERSDGVLRELIPRYIGLIDEMKNRVSDALNRLEELIDYSKNKHKAPSPQSSAFWLYVMEEGDEMRRCSDMIEADIPSVANDYLLNERPLELWERTSPPGSPEFNPWEWELVEKAALRLIPYSGKVLDLSVCRILRDSPEKAENFAQLFMRSSSPFIILKAGKPGGEIRGTFEIPKEGCEDIHRKLEDSVKGNFSSLSSTDSLTIYRISLFSFMEGIELSSLNIGG